MNILCFGDSITWGAWDREGGWTARLRKRLDAFHLDEDPDSWNELYNCGISGDTSRGLLRRLQHQIDAHLVVSDEIAMTICIGTNDACFDRATQKYHVPIDEYRGNINAILRVAKDVTSRLVVVGLAGVDDRKTNPCVSDPSTQNANADIAIYDGVAREVAAFVHVPFLDVFEPFNASDPVSMLDDDGLHPNDKGHQFIADLVWPIIAEWTA